MTVRKLIEILQEMNQDAEVLYPVYGGATRTGDWLDLDEVRESNAIRLSFGGWEEDGQPDKFTIGDSEDVVLLGC